MPEDEQEIPEESRQERRLNERLAKKAQKKLENKGKGKAKSKVDKNGDYKYKEDLVEEGKDISLSEKRAIASDVSQLKVNLDKMKDSNLARVSGQNVALVSFLSPFTSQTMRSTKKQPKIELEAIFKKYRIPQQQIGRIWNIIHDELTMAIKVRGTFDNEDAAISHLKQNVGNGDFVDPWILDMYEYKMIPPNKYADKERLEVKFGDDKTQEYYTAYRKQQKQTRLEKDKRVENFKTKIS